MGKEGNAITLSEFEKNISKTASAESIFVSANAETKDMSVKDIVSKLVVEKVKTGRQLVVMDNLDFYQNSLKDDLEKAGYQIYHIDPFDDYEHSDSINVMPAIVEKPDIESYASTFVDSLVGFYTAPFVRLAYVYYTEAIEKDPEKCSVAGLIDTMLTFESVSEADLSDKKNNPETAALYSEIFFVLARRQGYTPAETAEHTGEIHKEIVESVAATVSRDAEIDPKLVSAIKEVYSGAGRNISLEPGSSRNRAIFLNSPGLATDKVMSLVIKLLVKTDPETIVVLDTTLPLNEAAIRVPNFCKNYINVSGTIDYSADVLVLPNIPGQKAEESYIYKKLNKRNQKIRNITRAINKILSILMSAFVMTCMCITMVYAFGLQRTTTPEAVYTIDGLVEYTRIAFSWFFLLMLEVEVAVRLVIKAVRFLKSLRDKNQV